MGFCIGNLIALMYLIASVSFLSEGLEFRFMSVLFCQLVDTCNRDSTVAASHSSTNYVLNNYDMTHHYTVITILRF